jgi:hypothetical protein
MLFEIDDKIVSQDILTEPFACDPSRCHGACCVEGDSGAPVETDEILAIEEAFDAFSQFMTKEGLLSVEQNGVAVIDSDGDLTTPLVNGAECAYSFVENGVTLCAIERAWSKGLCQFRKPISCALYPIRVKRFATGSYGLTYHRWSACVNAEQCGKLNNIKVYQAVKQPLIEYFGQKFYDSLAEIATQLEK